MISALLLTASLLTTQSALKAEEIPAYVPANTTVAIIQVPHIGTEKSAELKAKLSSRALNYMTEEFSVRGFKVADQGKVDDAVKTAQIDLLDEESYRKDNLYAVGEATGAQLVAFAVITQNDAHIAAMRKQGFATIKFWLVDVNQKLPLANAISLKESSGGSIADGLRPVMQQERAIDKCLRAHLAQFFIKYPDPREKQKK